VVAAEVVVEAVVVVIGAVIVAGEEGEVPGVDSGLGLFLPRKVKRSLSRPIHVCNS
jgi:hypothetical protein